MKPVLSKNEFYTRWRANEFGNRLRVWMSIDELRDSGYTGKIGIRYTEPGSSYMKYDLPIEQVEPQAALFISMGANPSKLTFGEAAPDQHILFQGEVMRTENHLYLHYSLDKSQMRTALKNDPRHAEGIEARQLLRRYCNDSSYSDLEALLDIYDDHIIELSCYRINLGNIPNRNTLIWEVRRY